MVEKHTASHPLAPSAPRRLPASGPLKPKKTPFVSFDCVSLATTRRFQTAETVGTRENGPQKSGYVTFLVFRRFCFHHRHPPQALAKTGCQSAFIDTPEAKFADHGNYDKNTLNQADGNKPKRHRLIQDLTPVRDFTRMYQCADEKRAEALVKDFMEKEKLSASDPRVSEFRDTMYASVANYTRTVGFMDYELRVLQKNFWGITGPEKG